MPEIRTISDYLKHFAAEIGERVVQQFPALHKPGDSSSPFLRKLKRQPFPGQELTIMGIAKQWERSSSASAIAECGTGKTLIALASISLTLVEGLHRPRHCHCDHKMAVWPLYASHAFGYSRRIGRSLGRVTQRQSQPSWSQFCKQPCLRDLPVALRRLTRNAKNFRTFLDRQATEIA